jgi:hypothetical protein
LVAVVDIPQALQMDAASKSAPATSSLQFEVNRIGCRR